MAEPLSWTVKGVTLEERDEIAAGATRAGLKIGRFVVAACQAQIAIDREPPYTGAPEPGDSPEAYPEAPPPVLTPIDAIERLARLALELAGDNRNDATMRLARGVVGDQLRRFRQPRIRRLQAADRTPEAAAGENTTDGKD